MVAKLLAAGAGIGVGASTGAIVGVRTDRREASRPGTAMIGPPATGPGDPAESSRG